MVNVAQVLLPARSVTMKICIHSVEIVVQLVYAAPSSVAHERFVSENVMDLFPE